MKSKVVKNVSVILACSVAAKVLSYIWEAILATFFGVSDQADAFYLTTSVFNILYPILDLGIWKVFLPIYKTKLVENNEEKASQIANIAITLFFTLTVGLVILLVVLARPLVAVFAPGFDAAKKAMTVEYLRLCTPYLLFAAVSSVVGAMLQSREKFLGSQIREIGTHVARLACISICFHRFGIYAAILAMIVGSVVRLIIQFPFINWKWKFRPNFDFKDNNIATMIKGLPSVSLTAAISHLNGMIDKMVASGAASGAVACLNYGHKLMHVFSGMISTAVATAVYPSIIQYIAEDRKEKLKELLRSVIGTLGFIIVPITCFCMLFSTEIVAAAFQRGAFDASATELTSAVFVGYCFGMLFTGIATTVTNVFYGYGDTKITMYLSMLNIVLNIIFDLLFIRIFDVAGLAYATSISAMICLSVRFVYLRRYIRLGYKTILTEYAKILFISAVSCGIPYVIFSHLLDLNLYLSLILSGLVFGGIYLGLSLLLKIKELEFVKNLLMKKMRRGGKNRKGE